MKTRKFTSAIAATALMLPIAAWGQSSSTASEEAREQSKNRQETTVIRAGDKAEHDKSKEMKHDKSKEMKHEDKWTSTSASSGQIQKIKEDKLEHKATANNLTGKTVVGSDDQRIGTVHDIGLESVLPSGLQMVSAEGAEDDPTFSTQTASSSSQQASSSSQSMSSGNELTIYVAVGGVLGIGSNIVAIPASEFSYDAENDQLRLNQPANEVERIANAETDTELETEIETETEEAVAE